VVDKVEGKIKRGGKRPGSGRKPGTPNKTTADVKAAIAKLAQDNILRVQGWLDKVATEDPEKAIRLYLDILEYNVPKQARTVVAGDPENPFNLLQTGVATVDFPPFTGRPTR
jgi:hypothetical protein